MSGHYPSLRTRSVQSLADIAARCGFNDAELLVAVLCWRIHFLAGTAAKPFVPVCPPGAFLTLGRFQPGFGAASHFALDPVIATILFRRVDNAGNMAACAQNEFNSAAEQIQRVEGAFPGSDMIFHGGQEVAGGLDLAQVDRLAANGQRTRLG